MDFEAESKKWKRYCTMLICFLISVVVLDIVILVMVVNIQRDITKNKISAFASCILNATNLEDAKKEAHRFQSTD